eukprot:1456230-Amphidinium_carterae.1
MVAITPRNRAHFVASGSPAPLSSDVTQQTYTHQWVPAGDLHINGIKNVRGSASQLGSIIGILNPHHGIRR